jgi:hypothetical protein
MSGAVSSIHLKATTLVGWSSQGCCILLDGAPYIRSNATYFSGNKVATNPTWSDP